jgi:hypothetical protein
MLDAEDDRAVNQISNMTHIWIALLFTAYLRVWRCYFEAFCMSIDGYLLQIGSILWEYEEK